MEPVCPRRRAVNRLHGTPPPEPVAATQSPVAQPKVGDGLEGRRRLLGQLRADPGVPQKAFDAELPVDPPKAPVEFQQAPVQKAKAPVAPLTAPVITSPRRAGRCRKCGHWINSGLEFHLKHCGVSAAQLQAEAVEIRRAMCFPPAPPEPDMPANDPEPDPVPVFKPEWLAEPVKRGPARPRKIHD